MYYKIISGGLIVDASEGINFVRWQGKNGIMVSCSEADAEGIVSSDGMTVYLLDGAEERTGYSYVSYEEITENECEAFHAQLTENGIITETGSVESETETGTSTRQTEAVAKSTEMKRIEELETQVELLTECILEMSGIVYGD